MNYETYTGPSVLPYVNRFATAGAAYGNSGTALEATKVQVQQTGA